MDGIEAGKGRLMLKRRPDGGGVVQLGGEQRDPTQITPPHQPIDSVSVYRALTLIARFQIDPQLAVALGALAFGGGR